MVGLYGAKRENARTFLGRLRRYVRGNPKTYRAKIRPHGLASETTIKAATRPARPSSGRPVDILKSASSLNQSSGLQGS